MPNYCTDSSVALSLPISETTTRRSTPLFSLSGFDVPVTVTIESDNPNTQFTAYLYIERIGQILFNSPQELQPNDSIGIIIDISSFTEDTNLTVVNQNCSTNPIMTINLYKVIE